MSVKKEASGHSRHDTCHSSWGSELGKKCSWWQIVSSSQPAIRMPGVIILMVGDDVRTQDLMVSALALVHDPPVSARVTTVCADNDSDLCNDVNDNDVTLTLLMSLVTASSHSHHGRLAGTGQTSPDIPHWPDWRPSQWPLSPLSRSALRSTAASFQFSAGSSGQQLRPAWPPPHYSHHQHQPHHALNTTI